MTTVTFLPYTEKKVYPLRTHQARSEGLSYTIIGVPDADDDDWERKPCWLWWETPPTWCPSVKCLAISFTTSLYHYISTITISLYLYITISLYHYITTSLTTVAARISRRRTKPLVWSSRTSQTAEGLLFLLWSTMDGRRGGQVRSMTHLHPRTSFMAVWQEE